MEIAKLLRYLAPLLASIAFLALSIALAVKGKAFASILSLSIGLILLAYSSREKRAKG